MSFGKQTSIEGVCLTHVQIFNRVGRHFAVGVRDQRRDRCFVNCSILVLARHHVRSKTFAGASSEHSMISRYGKADA
jgi:hypothetical protein